MASTHVPLTTACEQFHRAYHELRAAYLRGDIAGGRSQTGRILLDRDSVASYVATRTSLAMAVA